MVYSMMTRKYIIFIVFFALLFAGCNKNPKGFITMDNKKQLSLNGANSGANKAKNSLKLAFVTSFQDSSVSVVTFSTRTTTTATTMPYSATGGLPTDLGMLDNGYTTITSHRHSNFDFVTGSNPSDIIVTKDKKYVITANAGEDSLSIFPIETLVNAIQQGKSADGKPGAVAAMPEGQKVDVGGEPIRLTQTGDGKYILCANRSGRTLSVLKKEGGTLSLIKDIDIQYSPNDVDIIDISNLIIVSSFIDGAYAVLRLDQAIGEGEEGVPQFIQQFSQVSSLSVAEGSKNLISANLNLLTLFPQGAESLIRNSSQMPIPMEGSNSDVMFDRRGKLAVSVNQSSNTASMLRFNSNIPIPNGFQEEYENLNFQQMQPVSVGLMPVRVFVDPNGKYAITVNSGSRDISFLSINYINGLQPQNRVQVGDTPSAIALY